MAARLVSRPDAVTGPTRFCLGPEAVLHRRIHLTLELQEIPDRQIFGFEDAEEDVVVFRRPRQVDVIVARQPARFGHWLEPQLHTSLAAGSERKFLECGFMEKPAVRFHAVLAGRQNEARAPAQEKEVRLLVGRDLERRRGRHTPPEPFTIEEIYVQRQQGVDGAQSERTVVLEQIDARRHARGEVELGRQARQAGLAELHPREHENGAEEEVYPSHRLAVHLSRWRHSARWIVATLTEKGDG